MQLYAPIKVRREAFRKYPHIVAFYFCQIIERGVSVLLQKSLVADLLCYRNEFQLCV